VVVLDEEEAMQEKTRRRAGLSDDAGSGSLMTKTQSAGRRPVQTDGAAGIAQHSRQCTGDGDVDATVKRTHGQWCSLTFFYLGYWLFYSSLKLTTWLVHGAFYQPDEATQQQPCCSEKMRVVLEDSVDEVFLQNIENITKS